MKISIPVNHNFYEEVPISEADLAKAFAVTETGLNAVQQLFSSVYELKLGKEQLNQVSILNFKRPRPFEPKEEPLILKLYTKENISQEKKILYTNRIICRYRILQRLQNQYYYTIW